MRKIQLFVLSVVVVLFTACHGNLWDAIEDLDARVARLEELCKEMNTNITSLQTIVSVIQENDVITGITPIEKGGKVIGYTITFGKHDPITIYNGEDGKDGANGANGVDGKDGYTPILGVAKDTDGVYYWTLDGEWLLDAEGNKLRVTGRDGKDGIDGEDGKDGADGKDGQDGQDGKDGTNGTNGVDGKDGVTPQLKIEEGYWYISYDNGATWAELGKAVGEDGKDGVDGENGKDGQDGKPGADGKDGDSMFTSVTYDENNVYFTLTDGSVLIVPRGKNSGTGENDPFDIIKFEDLNVKSALLQMDIDINGDGEISYGEAAAYTGSILMKNNTNILSFKEFQYFTSISTRLGNGIIYSSSSVKEYVSFQGCSNLFEIILPSTIDTIGTFAFAHCSKLKRIILPKDLVCIGNDAFYECTSLSDINIPDKIEYIGVGAFYKCPLKHFTYPKKLKSTIIPFISSSGGGGCAELVSVNWNCENNIEIYYNSAGYDRKGLAAYGHYSSSSSYGAINPNISNITFGEYVTLIPNYLCQYTKIKEITIPNTITSIGDWAFRGCSSLTSITIPNSVNSIGEYAFYECKSLTSITIPNSITEIKQYTFSSCNALNTITLGENISSLENYAFYGCSSLYMVYSKNPMPPTLGSNVFSGTKIGIIYVPTASVSVYKAAWSDYADKIVGYDF